MEKEDTFNLKTIRLRMLEAIGEAIANQDYNESSSRLAMFINSIDKDSEASVELVRKMDEVDNNYQKDLDDIKFRVQNTDRLFKGGDLLGGYDEQTFVSIRSGEAKSRTILHKHQVLWDLSLKFNLIPKE